MVAFGMGWSAPIIFNAFLEGLPDHQDLTFCVSMNKIIVTYFLHADDLVVISETPEEFQNTLTAFMNFVNGGIYDCWSDENQCLCVNRKVLKHARNPQSFRMCKRLSIVRNINIWANYFLLLTAWSNQPAIILKAPVPLSIFRSNSKFDENSKHSSVKWAWPITTIFCTRHDSVTTVTCAKYRCDRSSLFETLLPINVQWNVLVNCPKLQVIFFDRQILPILEYWNLVHTWRSNDTGKNSAKLFEKYSTRQTRNPHFGSL